MPTTPKSINVAVAEQVEKLGSTKVVETVVDKLVTAEVAKRADALAAAVKLSEDTGRELKKASKPDQVSIAADGAKTETFSAKAFEAKGKLEQKLAKIDKIVGEALDNGKWGELYNLVKNGGSEANDAAANS